MKKKLLALFLLAAVAAGSWYAGSMVARLGWLPPGVRLTKKVVYLTCGHEEKTFLREAAGERVAEVRRLFGLGEEWSLRRLGGEACFVKEARALCPACRRLTHLEEKGGFVAVVRGPVGVAGGVVRVTPIRVPALPPPLRKELQEKGLDLPDEVALGQVLDSYDEEL